MYVPKTFAIDDVPLLHDFMQQFNFATLVTQRGGELIASHLPFVLDRTVEPYGTLRAHLAIRNPQLADLKSGAEALVIFQGPHTYVSPTWYVKPENVPTWNYTAVHAYGIPKIADRAGMITLLRDLVAQHDQWTFDPDASWIQTKSKPHPRRPRTRHRNPLLER
jgi:transcriptional regulator